MDSEGFDLGKFLEDARAAGVKDSEGSFTLEQERSLTKLARFNLPHAYDWVFKIVQAANAWECRSLIVEQRRRGTSFFLRPPARGFPEDDCFITALTTGTYDQGGPVDSICMALRSLVDQVGLSFVLASRRRDVVGKPIYSGHDTSSLSEAERARWSDMSEQGIRLTVSHFTEKDSFSGRYIPTFAQVERRDVVIANLLARASYSSTTDIYLDGLRVSDPCLHPELGSRGGGRAVAFGVVGDEVTSSVLDPRARLTQLRQSNLGYPFDSSWFYFRTCDWLALPYFELADEQRSKLPIRLAWTRNGVVARECLIPSPCQATTLSLFFNADAFRSDLTGLSVELNDEKVEETRETAQAVVAHLRKIPGRIRDYLEDDERVQKTSPTAAQPVSQDVELGDTDTLLTGNLLEATSPSGRT